MYDPIYMIITFLFMGISWAVSNTLQRRFKEYSQMPINLTGAQIAEKMLNQNGVYDVKVVSVPGALTDHYNPATKTVNLSDWVYAQSNVAAAAVAAHECGHAVQHNEAYTWLTTLTKDIGHRLSGSENSPCVLNWCLWLVLVPVIHNGF